MTTAKEAIDKTLSPEAWEYFEDAMNALPPVLIALVRHLEDEDETESLDLIKGYAEVWLKDTPLGNKHPMIDLASEMSGRILNLALDEATKWWMAVRMAEHLFLMIDEVIDD